MLKRTVSGLIGVVLVLGLLVFNQSVPMLLNVIVALVCACATYEIFSAMGIYKMLEITLPSVIFSMIMPIFGYGLIWQISWYLYTFIIFCMLVFLHRALSFKDIAVIYSMTMLITISLGYIMRLRDLGGKNFGTFYVLFVLAIPWLCDTGAYFSGKFFGKRKLCPEISPKKTVAGAIGGIIVSTILTVLICVFYKAYFLKINVHMNYFKITIIAVIASIISIMGDLIFSMVKRGCHIKDFGNVIPGHGGVLDRFDSVIFTVPFVYIILRYVNIVSLL